MRLLITGITGFVGSHMAEYALAQGATVIGSVRWRSRMDNIEHLRGRVELVECDLRDTFSVRQLLAMSRATHIIHLAAAQSFVGAMGWQVEIPFERRTLEDLLTYWRQNVRSLGR